MRVSDSIVRRIFLKDERLRPIFRALIYVAATFVGAIFLAGLLASLTGTAFAPTQGGQPSYARLLVFEIALAASVVGVAILLRRYLDRRSVASLGLVPRGPWVRLLLLGVLLGAGMQCLIFAIDEALGYSRVLGVAGIGADLVELAKDVPLFALVAIAEEMSTRGYLFQNLWEEWGVVAAIVSTSALFAFLHLGNPNSHTQLALTLSGLLAYSVWACLSVIWTKSLWCVVGVHFAWNLFEGPVLGFPVSGLDFNVTALRQTIAGPYWFTGGPFGPESGAVALVAMAAGLALLYLLYRRGAFSDAYDAREAYAQPNAKG